MLLSTGNSFVFEALPSTFASSFDLGTLLPVDFNNDGKTDVLNLTSNHKSSMPLSAVTLTIDCLTRNTTGSWESDKSVISGLNAYFYRGINPIMVKPSKAFGGKPELLLYETENYSNGEIEKYKINFFVKNNALTFPVKTIKSIITGNGVKETITYSPLINENNVYRASPQIEKFPNIDINSFPSFQVVSKLEKESKDAYKKQLFSYYGAVSNAEGLGFLGFRSTVQTNWHNDSSPIISYISKYDISLRGANIENYTVLGLHDPLLESPNQIPSSIIKEQGYTVTGTENLVAIKSIILKSDAWIKSGSVFSARINSEANTSINTPSTFITKSLLTYESDLLPNKVFKIKIFLINNLMA